MKKLIFSAMIAGSMMVMAEDAAKPAEAPKADAPAVVAASANGASAEVRAAKMAEVKQRMAVRKAEMEKKAIEIIKKYGLDEAKAKELLAELEAAMKPTRRPRPAGAKRSAKPAAPAKAE